MKRVIALILGLSLLLTGCGVTTETVETSIALATESVAEATETTEDTSVDAIEEAVEDTTEEAVEEAVEEEETATSEANVDYGEITITSKTNGIEDEEINVSDLSNRDTLEDLENAVYESIIEELDSADYYVESVTIRYISQEYMEEVEYNSKANIYFGYTLESINNCFGGERYIFTVNDDNETVVKAFEEYDDTYDQVLKNVAVGSGVILVCATVSFATAGAYPAVSLICAIGAKTGLSCATVSGLTSGLLYGTLNGIATNDINSALKTAALEGSEGFKWGAIAGTLTGAIGELVTLGLATKSGLTMSEAALLQKSSSWSASTISQIQSSAEGEVYLAANLEEFELASSTVEGRTLLLSSDIDWSLVDDVGRTNLERALEGLAPLDSSGISYELHHVGQDAEGILATLTKAQHTQNGNDTILHSSSLAKCISDSEWIAQKKAVWKEIGAYIASVL